MGWWSIGKGKAFNKHLGWEGECLGFKSHRRQGVKEISRSKKINGSISFLIHPHFFLFSFFGLFNNLFLKTVKWLGHTGITMCS
ncbi:hypothetical protein Hanom_Chr04g00346711 [Helianthus anomalus]